MTKERALEINNLCIQHTVSDHPESLEGISLGDMLEATRITEKIRPHRKTCDDRMLAALYMVYNYEPQSLDGDDLAPLVTARGGAMVVVVK